jgi:hypothetical protein
MNVGSLVGSRSRNWGYTEIKGKSERPTDSRNTANDIGAINRAAIPGVSGSMGGFDEDGVCATVVGCNTNSFVQKSMEMFDTNGFVVASSSDMDFNVEDRTNFLEKAFESAAIVDRN